MITDVGTGTWTRAIRLGGPGLAAVVAAAALLGLAIDEPSTRGTLQDWAGMNPLTAVLLIVLSAAVASMNRRHAWAATAAATFIVALGALGLMRMAGVDFALDVAIFRSRVGPAAHRMAPNNALCFVFLGLGVLAFARRDRWSARLFAAAGVLAGLALVGHLYRAASLTQVTTFIPMASNTAVALLALALAGLVENRHHPFIERLLADDLSGIVSRRLMGPIVVVPLLAGWAGFIAEEAGLLSLPTAAALMAVLTVALLVALASIAAGIIHRMDVERGVQAAERESRIVDLQGALDREQVSVRPKEQDVFEGIVTVCSGCKRVPEGDGLWLPLEVVVNRHFGVQFSHGICPECTKVLYPEYHERQVRKARAERKPGSQ
jgi:hypothetical protein